MMIISSHLSVDPVAAILSVEELSFLVLFNMASFSLCLNYYATECLL